MRHISSCKKFTLISAAMLLLGFLMVGIQPVHAENFQEKVDKDRITIARLVLRPGMVPPDFTVTDMNGNRFSLSGMSGQMPVVLDFWATWCNPCTMEMPLVNEFAAKHEGEVVVVGITSEDAESEEIIRTFLAENGYTIRIIHQPSREISASYGVTGIPYLVVIGTDGIIVGTHIGYSETVIEDLEEELGL